MGSKGPRGSDPADGTGHADRVHETAQSGSAAALSSIAASWRRSINRYGLSPESLSRGAPLDTSALTQARDRMGRLAPIAVETMERLFATVAEAGCCVVLTDARGVIVERRGALADDDIFAGAGLWTATDWSERAEGTNGIGTCLIEERPVIVYRDDHFHSRNIAMSCMGAPVFDHEGRLAAVLDLSSCRADMTTGFAKLAAQAVTDAARRIESQNFQAAFPGERIIICEGDGEHGGASGAMLLAVDRDDLVVGATRKARRALKLGEDDFRTPQPLSDVLARQKNDPENAPAENDDLDAAARTALRQALARARGNVSAAARNLGLSRATFYRRMERLGVDPRG